MCPVEVERFELPKAKREWRALNVECIDRNDRLLRRRIQHPGGHGGVKGREVTSRSIGVRGQRSRCGRGLN
jgi:hypothetical protein